MPTVPPQVCRASISNALGVVGRKEREGQRSAVEGGCSDPREMTRLKLTWSKRLLGRWQRASALNSNLIPHLAIPYVLCVVLTVLLVRERLMRGKVATIMPKPTLDHADMKEDLDDVFVAGPSKTESTIKSQQAQPSMQSADYSGASQPYRLGKHMCVIQPVKSPEQPWTPNSTKDHVALKAFLASFVESVDPQRDQDVVFSIFYGYDAQDPVFGQPDLLASFHAHAKAMTSGIPVDFHFRPLFGLDGRLTGIWNDLARSAYHKGCDYFFMSNDDMALYTKGWASTVIDSFETSKHRRCKYLGIVRFRDRWANWALFTFHVSSRLHMEIFDETYYRVPYYNSHNDLWIHYVYKHVGSNLNKSLQVRNRVNDFRSLNSTEEARYEYDKKGNTDFNFWKDKGRKILQDWMDNAGDRCVPTH
eukprot:Plantae.Rhodophyta-Purpureofilum_apyrenoidigerum.ctg9987.p1 GENE.Plantae.Rhodophyta-Purpureofilum_apyrenoidigerum.ctg9987~~Plantae.Rhodophyta-Purpureofilum_apyrenoidigerum.ctg9987.p1  ORF type:complete len:419 (-),score=40.31 Plantae.Rhodophyta-Purpureofilum_apyrenoidigerum.ctg9987:270-1526(-)